MIVALILWFGTDKFVFDLEVFIIGFIASFVIGLGVAMIQNGVKTGPAGPVMGITAMSSVVLIIILAIYE